MDLTLSYFEPFTLKSTKQAVEAVLLGHEVGAAHGSSEGGWFTLPPEAVWSRLPCDPQTAGGRDLPRAQIVGTAQIGVFHVNASPELQVLVTTVRITIPAPGRTSPATVTQDPPWHDLVATPGRAITYEISKRVQDKWDVIAESAAVASSRGIACEQALSLRTIGRRRTVSIREAARAAGLSGRSLQRREIQISSFGKIFLEGQSICDTAPTPDELVLVGTATSVDRVILDLLLNGLQRVDNSLRDQTSDPMECARQLEDDLDYLGSALPVPRTASNDGLQYVLDYRLSILADSARCRDELWRVNQTFDRCLVRRLIDDVRSLSLNAEAIIKCNQAIAAKLEAKSKSSGWSAIHSGSMAITMLILGTAVAWNAIWLGFGMAACMWIMMAFIGGSSGDLTLRTRARSVEQVESD